MRKFQLCFTGDYQDENGEVAYGDIGRAALGSVSVGRDRFLSDQKPDGESYWDRLYSLEIEPHHVAAPAELSSS